MTPVVHLPQVLDRDPRTDGSRGELGVAKHLLDVPDVRPTLEEVGRHAVTQQVARSHIARPGLGGNVWMGPRGPPVQRLSANREREGHGMRGPDLPDRQL